MPIGKSKQTGLRTLRLDAHIRDVVDLLRKDFAKLKRKAAPVGKTYRVGDLAWGKLDGFPWFPLEVCRNGEPCQPLKRPSFILYLSFLDRQREASR